MSPTESTKRVTRSSTQSQTLKAHANAKAKQEPMKAKETGKIEKHRAKPKGKARHTAGAASKSKSNPKPEKDHDEEKGEDAPESNPSPTPPNVTTSTITSEQVNKPIVCHTYTPSTPPTSPPLVFTHGAGGTLSAPAVINFCTGFISSSSTPVFAFQGSMNLGARTKAFHACLAHVRGVKGGAQKLLLGGRSMGARAAVMAATEEIAARGEGQGGQKGDEGDE
ncbi:hypothetical protein N0V95_005477 [Ascochyta clinopodiicola]|nr:hypothetical protein N0V95_005477 [Ascochyta clinopodiicola]